MSSPELMNKIAEGLEETLVMLGTLRSDMSEVKGCLSRISVNLQRTETNAGRFLKEVQAMRAELDREGRDPNSWLTTAGDRGPQPTSR